MVAGSLREEPALDQQVTSRRRHLPENHLVPRVVGHRVHAFRLFDVGANSAAVGAILRPPPASRRVKGVEVTQVLRVVWSRVRTRLNGVRWLHPPFAVTRRRTRRTNNSHRVDHVQSRIVEDHIVPGVYACTTTTSNASGATLSVVRLQDLWSASSRVATKPSMPEVGARGITRDGG